MLISLTNIIANINNIKYIYYVREVQNIHLLLQKLIKIMDCISLI